MNFIILFLWLGILHAEDFSNRTEMNDISFSQYKDFAKEWTLVTIRHRKDTGEMRLTYANKLAWETLSKGIQKYPDGAVFAKTGVHTGADPQFTSSVVPRGIRRYQFMVREKKKYASTGGWGYALFDEKGRTFPEGPKETADACYACHTIVENRGDVFSEPFDFVTGARFGAKAEPRALAQIRFEWVEFKNLPEKMKPLLPTGTQKIRSLVHTKLQDHVFQGTLDELKPILQNETRVVKTPAAFISRDGKKFLLLIQKKTDNCMGMGEVEATSTTLKAELVTERYCNHD